jgi:predicted short-subunit dehydrogenase-like oxidoreductase (DUF2520 family)
MKSINIIGAGKVGKVLAKLWQQKKTLNIRQIVNQHIESAESAAIFIGAGQACHTLQALTHADLTLITVPDDRIADVATQLASLPIFKTGDIVLHCSGALSSEILTPCAVQGARLVSLHPPFSFADEAYAMENLPGTYCVLEGEESACQEIQQLLSQIDLQSIMITAKNKLIYHAALIMASNYVATLLDVSISLLKKIDITEEDAQHLVQPLVQGVIDQSFSLSPEQALTGPIDRAETRLIAQQIQALVGYAPDMVPLYQCMGKYTVELARRKHQWSDEEVKLLKELVTIQHSSVSAIFWQS